MNGLSPKIIRAFFDTIFNPLIEGLENEKYCLEKNNLTWRGFHNSFASLMPLFNFTSPRYLANLEQLATFCPEINDIIAEHDSTLAKLTENTSNLFIELKQSEKMKELIQEFVFRDDNEPDIMLIDHIQDGTENDNIYLFLAEYIINRQTNLEKSYLISSLWNSCREKFIDILNGNGFKLLSSIFEQSKNDYLIVVKKSLHTLKTLRNTLSLKYGEPIIMPLQEA